MNVFVTGGAGYIGSVCVEALLKAGHRVTVFDNLSEGHRDAVDPRARFVLGDLNDETGVRKALREAEADAVFHFAASALVGESMRQPEKYFRNNLAAGINLLDAMLACGVNRLIFSSSCATYGQPVSVPMREEQVQAPINPYGESKLQFERMMPWYAGAHGLTYVGLRFFNVAGATETRGEDHRVETHLIPNVLRVALGQRDSIEIFGDDWPTSDGTCCRDFLHVEDIASAHLIALEAGKSGFYNLGLGRGHTVGEVIAAARDVTGHAIPVDVRPRRVGDPAELVADATRIRTELGWRPRYTDLRTIIASAWAWHSRRPHGY
jgi:UDP-glucose 4-epimerase